jgi:hypothetical protein
MTRRSAFERRLRRELHGARPPRADAAERRAWHVVRAAHAARAPVRAPHRLARLAAAVAAAVVAAALALTPAGAKMGDWIDDVVNPAPEATRSSLSSLPVSGRLLVVADSGAWVVHDDGRRRRLGGFSDVTWSPAGRFVAGARGHELVAVDPTLGHERWTRPASGRVSVPRWSPDGYRVAYRSGSDLRVSTGDNTDDWLLSHDTASTPPAWRPLPEPAKQVLAFAAGGRVRIVQVDTGDELGRTPVEPTPREIWWADDGRRLVTVGSRTVRIHGSRGRLLRTVRLPAGSKAVGSAVPRRGRRLAVIATRGSASSLLVLRLDRATAPRSLFSARGEFAGVTWSIDGSLILVGLPQADQWLYVRPRGARAPESVGRIRHWFEGGLEPRRGAFPRPAGWCYREPAVSGTSGQPPCLSGAAP